MIQNPYQHDLVVLAADRYMEFALRGILCRNKSLNIRTITYEIYNHPEHDPGCFIRSPEFLHFELTQANYALVVLDYHGCGQEHQMSRQEIERDIESRLSCDGWHDRSAAVVIQPELENWIWSDSPHVSRIIGWDESKLRKWLISEHHLQAGMTKPTFPKEVLQIALVAVNKSKSASMYKEIADVVSLNRCTDHSFLRLKNILQRWFSSN